MKNFLIILLTAIILVLGSFFILNLFFDFTGKQENEKNTASSKTVIKEMPTSNSEEVDHSVKEKLKNMSLEEKVGQLFFVRVPEQNQVQDIETYHLGGYVLFGRDMENETKESLIEKIKSYQDASDIPLLIGSDEEGGTVTRLSQNANLITAPFASPQALYEAGGFAAIKSDTISKAKILHEFGINAGLFPIADVATDPNAFIYDRTIGLDEEETSEYVTTVVKALAAEKSGSTLKHFPGYGNNRDSHVEIVHDTRSLQELRQTDFKPFKAGIKAGADSILVSHNIITHIDQTKPASISKPVHDVLRNELGFKGVIMTDDMDMAGLADFISQAEAGLAALQAGNDLIMSSSYQVQIPTILAAIKAGKYAESDLDTAVVRVLTWKKELGLLN
ncbi:beta-N-acetylhexosaminidase [Enterococcus saigonensis]|uniref:beta-N-acetylhexosaminidase n=1 Tax=Enterococcus saigonensis TaxID=1805431 RepID=A0A679I9C7_9ENTE|nr:glycoside hydrolase family 3 N-terminal domain-containing protein [Enterococcus saigonensis]BCA84990.1 beta-N-acetylhexosaminidase [Enterococcus saigonensis]